MSLVGIFCVQLQWRTDLILPRNVSSVVRGGRSCNSLLPQASTITLAKALYLCLLSKERDGSSHLTRLSRSLYEVTHAMHLGWCLGHLRSPWNMVLILLVLRNAFLCEKGPHCKKRKFGSHPPFKHCHSQSWRFSSTSKILRFREFKHVNVRKDYSNCFLDCELQH